MCGLDRGVTKGVEETVGGERAGGDKAAGVDVGEAAGCV